MSRLTPMEASIGNPRRMIALASASFLIGLGHASPTAIAETDAPVRGTAASLSDCAPFFNLRLYPEHQYEVCTAYIANSAGIALQGMYKYGNSDATYARDGAKHRFETRYFDGPRQSIEFKVASWPTTTSLQGNRVMNSVQLQSISSSEENDRALLQTRESWNVTAPDGKVLYDEPTHTKNITMCRGRLPKHPLHSWLVAAFVRAPGYDCIAFDKRHGLKP